MYNKKDMQLHKINWSLFPIIAHRLIPHVHIYLTMELRIKQGLGCLLRRHTMISFFYSTLVILVNGPFVKKMHRDYRSFILRHLVSLCAQLIALGKSFAQIDVSMVIIYPLYIEYNTLLVKDAREYFEQFHCISYNEVYYL